MNARNADSCYWAVQAGTWRESARCCLKRAREAKRSRLPRENVCGWAKLALSAQRMFVRDLRLARAAAMDGIKP